MKTRTKTIMNGVGVLAMFAMLVLSVQFAIALSPDGPSNIATIGSTQKSNLSAWQINSSGGTITTINISGIIQNPRWKAFVGNVSGTFVLDDAAGNTIYDWNMATVTGKVFATRKATTVNWAAIACATEGNVNTENSEMSHTNPNDNVTVTFADQTHPAFYVGSTSFNSDQCDFTLNTYDGSGTKNNFEEVLLNDQSGVTGNVYMTILEQDESGFDSMTYDFQMIVPEKGSAGNTEITPYYLYVELGN
jgi:hypothetical protein